MSMRMDDVVAEVRAAREAYAARFGFDLVAIGRDLQVRERSGAWVVLLPPSPENAEIATSRKLDVV